MAFSDRRPVFNLSDTLISGVSAVATAISSNSFTGLPTVYTGEIYLPLVIADDSAGKAEVVYVTSHAAASNTVTVTRAREGTTAQAWNAGSVVRCAPTVVDTQRVGGHAGMTGSFVNNSPSTVTVPLIGQDLWGGVTVVNNTIVAPVSGLYRVDYFAYFSGGSVPYQAYMQVKRNGTADAAFPAIRVLKFDGNDYTGAASVRKRLSTGDALGLAAGAPSGTIYGSNGYNGCFIEIELLVQQ